MRIFRGKDFWLLMTYPCLSREDINTTIRFSLKESGILDLERDSIILVKPNLNNDIPGILGGTTDLRILHDVLAFLKQRGFKNVIIGDGPNVGVFHLGINVFKRLGLDKLAKLFNYQILDFNYADFEEVNLLGRKMRIAKICLENDFFINLPKIKTHSEALLSISLKNLVGCLVGYDKRKIHLGVLEKRVNFFERLLELNRVIRPNLHIVDGLIIMEGNGPSAGNPKKLGLILAGNNPFVLDVWCSKLIGIDPKHVPYLRLAFEKGMVTKDVFEAKVPRPLINVKTPPTLSRVLANVFLRNFFVFTRFKTDFIFSKHVVSELLCKTKLRQERFSNEELCVKEIIVRKEYCDHCNLCINYCPLMIDIPRLSIVKDCLKCMYCLVVCPRGAIRYVGQLGFLKNYLPLSRYLKQRSEN
jgi:uncharacterized protein (DUF362 family)/ferredoxin